MIWISLGRYCDAGGRWFHYRRLYIKGYIWTPFVNIKLRDYRNRRKIYNYKTYGNRRIYQEEQVSVPIEGK